MVVRDPKSFGLRQPGFACSWCGQDILSLICSYCNNSHGVSNFHLAATQAELLERNKAEAKRQALAKRRAKAQRRIALAAIKAKKEIQENTPVKFETIAHTIVNVEREIARNA